MSNNLKKSSPRKPSLRRAFQKKMPGSSNMKNSGRRPPRAEPYAFQLEASPVVQKALNRIGVPEDSPFVADEFQLKAVVASENTDVIVSAPTGSGKTWIAEQAILRELNKGGRAWYASPLKALSNGKFLEFGRIFGPENVGLLTGDHKVNTDAQLIIGTTEILRNQLYDAMAQGHDIGSDLVILDEAHYLGDRDRGVVWEEVLIYLPARVRLLLLSATVANAEELAAWLGRLRNRRVDVISGGERPVPLMGLTLWPSGHLTELTPRSGGGKSGKGRSLFNIQMPNSKIMDSLRELDLLPAIFFLKSRADCDAALGHISSRPVENQERRLKREYLINEYLEKYPFLAEHPHLGRLKRMAVAAHHAGHLPHYKLMVEELMTHGLLDAIFATSTVSAGVNFPARTVVVRQSDRFDGVGFNDLSANEFTQMTGRAGRRGRDKIGFALMIPGAHMNLGLMGSLMRASPDPVKSSLTINFSMVLNLLNAYRPKEVRRLLGSSLAVWQEASYLDELEADKPTVTALDQASQEVYEAFQMHLDFLKNEQLVDANDNLTPDGIWTADLRLDHPLVFYAGIKAGAWPLEGAALAAAVASLVSDKESNKPVPRRRPPHKLNSAMMALVMAAGPIIERLEDAGFDTPIFNLRPAWAIWHWANGGDFDESVELLGLGAGDLAMLALRAADHLRQLAALKGAEHQTLALTAKEAIYRILREPVSSPL